MGIASSSDRRAAADVAAREAPRTQTRPNPLQLRGIKGDIMSCDSKTRWAAVMEGEAFMAAHTWPWARTGLTPSERETAAGVTVSSTHAEDGKDSAESLMMECDINVVEAFATALEFAVHEDFSGTDGQELELTSTETFYQEIIPFNALFHVMGGDCPCSNKRMTNAQHTYTHMSATLVAEVLLDNKAVWTAAQTFLAGAMPGSPRVTADMFEDALKEVQTGQASYAKGMQMLAQHKRQCEKRCSAAIA